MEWEKNERKNENVERKANLKLMKNWNKGFTK